MAFAPVFGRPFAPTFDRHAAAAAAYFAVVFNGSSALITRTNTATIQDLPGGAFTAEAWFALGHTTDYPAPALFRKDGWDGSYTGWMFNVNYVDPSERWGTNVIIGASTNIAAALDYIACGLDVWVHRAVTYDNSGDRKARVWQDGELILTTAAAAGTYKSDAATALTVGSTLKGKLGWVRLSNVVRYTDTFTPTAYNAPPATDANTALLWRMTDGSGTTVTDASGNGNHGTLANGTWVAL